MEKANETPVLHQTLIDTGNNLRVEEWSADSTRLDPRADRPWRVGKSVLRGGR